MIGFLMFGNLIRECGVLNTLSETARNVLANLITILLGISIASRMTAGEFLRPQTLLILGLGLAAFVMDTVGGIMIAKLMNLLCREKINPMIGAAGISAFPMSARVVHKLGLAEDNQNFLLMHSVGVNVSGQIASVIAGGMILALVRGMIGGWSLCFHSVPICSWKYCPSWGSVCWGFSSSPASSLARLRC